MLDSLVPLLGACGALDAFSPAAWPAEEPVATGALDCVLLMFGFVEEIWPAAFGFTAVVPAASELFVDPVVPDAWLCGFVLVALVSPLLGFAAPGVTPALEEPEAAPAFAVGEVTLFTSVWLLFLLLVEAPALGFTVS